MNTQSGPLQGRLVEEHNGEAVYHVLNKDHETADYPRTLVPNGHCFVLGDNRSPSKDSRAFGPIPLADVKGRVEFIYLPAGSWKRFGPIDYHATSASGENAAN